MKRLEPIHRDEPRPGTSDGRAWGSDAIADTLRALDIPYLALNPGASFRGLHDSLVNHLGNAAPQLLLCLHEETAVAIAHGYAKASGRMMGAVLHSNVGLMHATMAVFNAWCDRVPLLLLGATGPWDAARRRPWIDWIHTCSDQGALVRDYTKWDNQPASVPAACEALLRAALIARTAPCGPTYVNLDAALQEQALTAHPMPPDAARFAPPKPVVPSAEQLAEVARLFAAARRPVVLAGRGSRSEAAWAERIALAEALRARVITDLKGAAVFPTEHPLHLGPPGHFLAPAVAATLGSADLVLALDWTDLAGTLRQAWGEAPVAAKVIHVSPDQHVHRGWSHDYQALPPVDLQLLCEPDAALPLLRAAASSVGARDWPQPVPSAAPAARGDSATLGMHALASALNTVAEGQDVCLTRLPLGWHGAYRPLRHPLDWIGLEGGAGVGAGPGLTVGAALALRDSDRIAVGVMGDGDFLMGNTAVWTACHYGIGALMIVANNRSFFNDELHQERVARERGRPVENKWIGQRIAKPDIDLAQMAASMGALGLGPVHRAAELPDVLARGLAAAREGRLAVVDVRVVPGYDGNPSGNGSDRGKA